MAPKRKKKKKKKLDADKRVKIAQRDLVKKAWHKKAGVHDRFSKGYDRAREKRRERKIIKGDS